MNKTAKFQAKPTYQPKWFNIPQKPPGNTSKYLPTTTHESSQKNQTHPLNIKTITPTDIQTKRSLGLCFRWDEKYTPRDICKNTMLNFMLIYEEEVMGLEGEGKGKGIIDTSEGEEEE